MRKQTTRVAATESVEVDAKSPSLRQRLRLLGRDAILDAASERFLKQGYRSTTMAAIAEGAGVGVATIFRYFKSKEGILAALSRRDIDKVKEHARAAVTPYPKEPAEAIVRLFTAVLKMHEMPSTQIRGQTRLWLLIPTGHPETDEVVTSSDRELQDTILELLTYYRKAGRVQKGLALDDMTITLFAVFYHHYLRMALDRSLPVEEVTRDLTRQIRLMFACWSASSPTPRTHRTR